MWRSFLFALFLTACANEGIINAPSNTINPTNKRNKDCSDSSKMKIFQVMSDGILAHLCPTTSNYPEHLFWLSGCSTYGDIVYMPVNSEKNDYVDDQRISLTVDKCIAPDGTYSYTTTNGEEKRVRKIKIIDSQVLP